MWRSTAVWIWIPRVWLMLQGWVELSCRQWFDSLLWSYEPVVNSEHLSDVESWPQLCLSTQKDSDWDIKAGRRVAIFRNHLGLPLWISIFATVASCISLGSRAEKVGHFFIISLLGVVCAEYDCGARAYQSSVPPCKFLDLFLFNCYFVILLKICGEYVVPLGIGNSWHACAPPGCDALWRRRTSLIFSPCVGG